MQFLLLGRAASPALAALACASVAFAAPPIPSDPNLPPFDFSDAYYRANGIDPTTIIGRPEGTGPGSVIDNRENGPNFNNVRLLQQAAAFDHSGHPIFFSVTGLPTLASFTNDAAGAEAFEIAEKFKVYEFPRAGNPPFGVFPKRQDLMADLSGGYFGNDPLGTWQINLVRYTQAAFDTQDGREELADLAQRNGLDLDGTPVIRTKSEIFGLLADGFVTIETPPLGGPDFRWFFCPVIEDPRNGAIAPDAHLDIVELANGNPLPAEIEIFDLFHCLQATGDECNDGGFDGFFASFGSGSTSTCPCANATGAAEGCTNSTGRGGRLVASGTARISADSLLLSGSQMPNTLTLYLQGSSQASAVLGDGVRLVGGALVRLGTRINAGGASAFPPAGGPSVSARGGVHPGDTRIYQAWYRDPGNFCTADRYNLTNGVRVIWAL